MNTFLIQQFPNRVSLAQAAQITGYHQDYLGRLCRTGKLKGAKIGRNWYTTKLELESLIIGGDLDIDQEPESEPIVNTRVPERFKSTDSAYIQNRPTIVKNVVVSQVEDMPVAISIKTKAELPTQTVQTLMARMRLEALQKDVLQMSSLIESVALEVKRHSQILAQHEALLTERPDLRSIHLGGIEAAVSPKQERNIFLLEEEDELQESLISPWILQTTSWVTIGLVAVIGFAGTAWGLYSSGNLNTKFDSVSTTYYQVESQSLVQESPVLDVATPQVAGDSTELKNTEQANQNLIFEP